MSRAVNRINTVCRVLMILSFLYSYPETRKRNKHESKNLLLECIARLPPLAIFIQSLVICVEHFILFYLSDTRLIQNTLLFPGYGTLIFRVITPSGKDGIEERSNSSSS